MESAVLDVRTVKRDDRDRETEENPNYSAPSHVDIKFSGAQLLSLIVFLNALV